MPELPEVESVVRALNRFVIGRHIVSGGVFRPKLLVDTTAEDLLAAVNGADIEAVERRGKFILIRLSSGKTLMTHLRMSGRFAVLGPNAEDPKFSHAIFELADGDRLVFSDQRHFGMMKVVDTALVADTREIVKLAPEPFSAEFSKSYLKEVLGRSTRSIKEVLTDQTKVCGLGNIYAAEALHISRTDPEMAANAVSSVKINRLHAAIRFVLQKAIDHSNGVEPEPDNFEGTYYSSGSEIEWSVYDREGKPCPKCGSPIARIAQGGRSTYYCRKCQRSPTVRKIG